MAEAMQPTDAWRKLSNRLLVIQTSHPDTVKALLVSFSLVDEAWFEEHAAGYVYVRYSEDLMSLALWLWLGAAKTCGLIDRWLQ